MTCEAWEIVAVPFPFSDKAAHKRRPALVFSQAHFNSQGHTLMAMITTSMINPWPGDTPIKDLSSAGLSVACVVRMKLFTLDNRLIIRQIGRLSKIDSENVAASLRTILAE